MASFTFVRHHGWYTKAAWTKSRKMKEGKFNSWSRVWPCSAHLVLNFFHLIFYFFIHLKTPWHILIPILPIFAFFMTIWLFLGVLHVMNTFLSTLSFLTLLEPDNWKQNCSFGVILGSFSNLQKMNSIFGAEISPKLVRGNVRDHPYHTKCVS